MYFKEATALVSKNSDTQKSLATWLKGILLNQPSTWSVEFRLWSLLEYLWGKNLKYFSNSSLKREFSSNQYEKKFLKRSLFWYFFSFIIIIIMTINEGVFLPYLIKPFLAGNWIVSSLRYSMKWWREQETLRQVMAALKNNHWGMSWSYVNSCLYLSIFF